jgi:hypothetical protein
LIITITRIATSSSSLSSVPHRFGYPKRHSSHLNVEREPRNRQVPGPVIASSIGIAAGRAALQLARASPGIASGLD